MKQTTKPATIDEYLAGVAEPALATLQAMRRAILAAAPAGTVETISYGMPTFKYNKKSFAGFAAFKAHCSYFPMGGGLLEEFAEELKGYAISKGTIRFPMDKPLPAALVKKLVKARIAAFETA